MPQHMIFVFMSFIFLSSLNCARSGMECKLGQESSFLEKINPVNPNYCPSLFDSSENEYCCVEGNHVYCCNLAKFIENGFGVLLPLIAVALILLVVCCLCCFCCPCCLLYKRRHRGTVYGNVLQSGVQTMAASHPVQQAPVYPPQPTPMPMPGSSQVPAYSTYPIQGQQPPPYSEVTTQDAYSKQAPYNPNFQ